MSILYIDPGTGSLLFQTLVSGFLTILVFYKRIKFFLKNKFDNFFKKKNDLTKNE